MHALLFPPTPGVQSLIQLLESVLTTPCITHTTDHYQPLPFSLETTSRHNSNSCMRTCANSSAIVCVIVGGCKRGRYVNDNYYLHERTYVVCRNDGHVYSNYQTGEKAFDKVEASLTWGIGLLFVFHDTHTFSKAGKNNEIKRRPIYLAPLPRL